MTFSAVLGWDSGIGNAFQIQGEKYSRFQRKTGSKKLHDFRLQRQETLLYKPGALDQWEWEDASPTCRTEPWAMVRRYPPRILRWPNRIFLMMKRQDMGEKMFEPSANTLRSRSHVIARLPVREYNQRLYNG
jgi:hypothetical protein